MGNAGTNGSRGACKKCFVISEFGTDDATRVERKQMLKHLVKKVLEPMGYEVQRADDIDDLGQITNQIIERLLDDDLVVADLTGLNPNVFYELAVRHAARKPVITLMTHGTSIPFDLKDVRTVFYDLHDPDALEAAQQELAQKARAIEQSPDDVRNPITVARNVSLLQRSDDPELQVAGEVLSAIGDLRDEMRAMNGTRRRTTAADAAEAARISKMLGSVLNLFAFESGEFTAIEVADRIHAPHAWTRATLDRLAADPGQPLINKHDDGRFSSRL